MTADGARHGGLAQAFTLIEVMVSLALSMMMLSLAWSGFVQMRKAVQSNQAQAFMALEASTVYRRMEHDIAATVPGAQVRIESLADLGADYGARRAVRFIAMCEQASIFPNGGQDVVILGKDQPTGAVWYCWEWRPPTTADMAEATARGRKAAGSIWHASSSALRRSHQYDLFTASADGTPQARNGVTFEQMPAFRRSRLRTDLDDNDLRLLEGWPLHGQRAYDCVTGTTRPLTVDGDRTDLMRQRGFVEQNVLSFSIGWIDHQGYLTRATDAGVTVEDASGSTVAHPGLAHWNADLRIVDGLWRDGRTTGVRDAKVAATDQVEAQTSVPDEGDVRIDLADPTKVQNCLQARPAVVFVNFVLYDPRSGTEVPYSFSMQVSLTAPAQGNL